MRASTAGAHLDKTYGSPNRYSGNGGTHGSLILLCRVVNGSEAGRSLTFLLRVLRLWATHLSPTAGGSIFFVITPFFLQVG